VGILEGGGYVTYQRKDSYVPRYWVSICHFPRKIDFILSSCGQFEFSLRS